MDSAKLYLYLFIFNLINVSFVFTHKWLNISYSCRPASNSNHPALKKKKKNQKERESYTARCWQSARWQNSTFGSPPTVPIKKKKNLRPPSNGPLRITSSNGRSLSLHKDSDGDLYLIDHPPGRFLTTNHPSDQNLPVREPSYCFVLKPAPSSPSVSSSNSLASSSLMRDWRALHFAVIRAEPRALPLRH